MRIDVPGRVEGGDVRNIPTLPGFQFDAAEGKGAEVSCIAEDEGDVGVEVEEVGEFLVDFPE